MYERDQSTSPTAALATFLEEATTSPLRAAVIEKTKHHIVDTFAAMISGARLNVGVSALRATDALAGAPDATTIGAQRRLPAYAAGMINAMLAHADETDDSHEMSKFHPGCAIVPAAMAICQRDRRSGAEMLRAVACGYDTGARILEALGPLGIHQRGHSTHACGSLFGAGAAASTLYRFDASSATRLISYLTHEASGLSSWLRDRDHIQKAYVFGAMSVKNALIAAAITHSGWTGVEYSLEGESGLFSVFGQSGAGRGLTEPFSLGDEILRSNIKKWCVGSPIQAALDSLDALGESLPSADTVSKVLIQLPTFEATIVNNRDMASISLQHLVALFLVDGGLTFDSVHDVARLTDPVVVALRDKISLSGSEALQNEGGRQAIVTVIDIAGRQVEHRTRHVRGTWGNPMPRGEVDDKARELMEPMLGRDRTGQLLERLWNLEDLSAAQLDQAIALAT
ncbi:2-methylcitrate dehydratase PrpD [Paraburkholderia sp. BL6669N2]|uniref:MmgE/PrpD family protein n=1 Tax=Paraburkholderia sp. BL6669N2 TaxID=1938807 RepID=UPI000E25E1C3|nr:MmgE/PrpD family protein [Paraburkholderia sp. BL6669N2]REG50979.1 2-methylcitrate dehydratase PrpD [Paraburkholderia sp. BL6669N2]